MSPSASLRAASRSPPKTGCVGRSEAAQMLSISCRALDYLIGKKQLSIRRIGSRVLIPMADLLHLSRSDHLARLVG